MKIQIFIISTFLTGLFASENLPEEDKLSDCVKKCLRPFVKMDRSYNYIFHNYEKVCDALESGANCAVKCGSQDQHKFAQFTTFYRIHCVNHEEEIEEHLECLKKASKEVDSVCKDKCKSLSKTEKTWSKEEKMARACKALECTTVCYFVEFATDCPDAKDLLMRINMDQINEVSNTIHPLDFEKMSHECRDIHDMEYMKTTMLAEL